LLLWELPKPRYNRFASAIGAIPSEAFGAILF
jgi:hypothetical protein